jgi:hypothetical protein
VFLIPSNLNYTLSSMCRENGKIIPKRRENWLD